MLGGFARLAQSANGVPSRTIPKATNTTTRWDFIAVGLAVPAMPLGSPGMDGPEYGGRRQPYDVLLVLGDGSARVYRSYA